MCHSTETIQTRVTSSHCCRLSDFMVWKDLFWKFWVKNSTGCQHECFGCGLFSRTWALVSADSKNSWLCIIVTTSNVISLFKAQFLLPNQTWVPLPACGEASLLTSGWGEGKYSIYCRVPNKENGQLMLKRSELPNGFQGGGFKGSVREGALGCVISSCTILGLVGIKFQAPSTFWFQPSRSYCQQFSSGGGLLP